MIDDNSTNATDGVIDAERAAFEYLRRTGESKVYRLDEVGALAARQICHTWGHVFGKSASGTVVSSGRARIHVQPNEEHDCQRCDATITITYPELGVER